MSSAAFARIPYEIERGNEAVRLNVNQDRRLMTVGEKLESGCSLVYMFSKIRWVLVEAY